MSTPALIFTLFCAFVAVVLIAGAVQHFTRPRVTVEPATPRPHGTCHVRGCGVRTYDKVTRLDTLTDEWTCQQCRYEGAVLGYWTGEVAS